MRSVTFDKVKFKVLLFLLLIFYILLNPSEIYSTTISSNVGDTTKLDFCGNNLTKSKRYELRVSWPSTSPANILFNCNGCNNADISDEKIMFEASDKKEFINVSIKASGVPRKGITQYNIPVNVSLEELHMGLTQHVWKLIFHALPTLALFVFLTVKITNIIGI